MQRPSLGRSDSVVRRPLSKRDSQWGRPWARRNQGYPLGTIQECSIDEFQPTIVTVEKAAATKIYLETHFNEKLKRDDPKDARRQYLETQLYYSPHLTEDQKNVVRGSLSSQESCHLRETRALKSKSTVACQGQEANPYIDNYEPLRVLVRRPRKPPKAGLCHEGHSQIRYAPKQPGRSSPCRERLSGGLRGLTLVR